MPEPRSTLSAGPDQDGLRAALDFVFAGYERKRHLAHGRFDRDFRKPHLVVDRLRRRGLLPHPDRAILVSGSKGKGTVARQLAWNLARTGEERVGLVVSPEEIDHLDRIRIDGRPIDPQAFMRHLASLRPALEAVDATPDHYVPPTAVFLAIALAWFREQGVCWTVLEGGRGVRHDEIGAIDARIGVVTSVFPEHLDRLGPTLQHIADDKLSLLANCEHVVAGPTVRPFVDHGRWRTSHENLTIVAAPPAAEVARPDWVAELAAIGQGAFGRAFPGAPWVDFGTPAFFEQTIDDVAITCEGAIVPESIDARFVQARGLQRGCAVVGLSDGKDASGIVARLRALGFAQVLGVRLASPIGHVDSAWLACAGLPEIDVVDVVSPDADRLRATLLTAGRRHGGHVYAVGAQLFVRSVRRALRLPLYEPAKP